MCSLDGHRSRLKELDVGVEQVALGHVDALHAQLVHQAQHARREHCTHAEVPDQTRAATTLTIRSAGRDEARMHRGVLAGSAQLICDQTGTCFPAGAGAGKGALAGGIAQHNPV